MTWTRLDDKFPWHPKVFCRSPRAFKLFVSSLCYCNAHGTDGALSPDALEFLRAREKETDELVAARLFDRHEDGKLWVHDFLEYNPSRANVEARREAVTDRVRNHRSRKNGNTVVTGYNPEHVTPPPSRPGPARPDQTQPDQTQSPPSVGSARVRASRRVPDSFAITGDHLRLAESEGIDINREFDKFRDHTFAKGRTDWDATFRNWLREAGERLRTRKPVVNGSPVNRADAQLQRQLERVAELEAEEARRRS